MAFSLSAAFRPVRDAWKRRCDEKLADTLQREVLRGVYPAALQDVLGAGADPNWIYGDDKLRGTTLLTEPRLYENHRAHSVLLPLLEYGAKANGVDAPDTRVTRPLHVAAAMNNMWAAQRLLEAGATIDARDRAGMTPLAVLLMNAYMDEPGDNDMRARRNLFRNYLLEAGADPNAAMNDGGSLLHIAVRYSHRGAAMNDLVWKLLKAGADPLAVNAQGRTPLDVLYTLNRDDMDYERVRWAVDTLYAAERQCRATPAPVPVQG